MKFIFEFFLATDDGSSLSEACSTPIIGAGSRAGSSHTVIDVDDIETGLHSGHLGTRASLSSLGVSILDSFQSIQSSTIEIFSQVLEQYG